MLALTVAVGLAGCATDATGPVSNGASTGASAGAWSGTTPTAGTAPAVRTAADLGDFAGPWAGHTDGKTEAERAATLLIEPGKDGGFATTWASFDAGDIEIGKESGREQWGRSVYISVCSGKIK